MPKRVLILSLLAFIFSSKVMATHIVGGEFELKYLQASSYRLTLNLYFDVVNGSPDALDSYIAANIFEKGSNLQVQTVVMPLRAQSFVPYTNIDCTVGSLSTKKLVTTKSFCCQPASIKIRKGIM